MTPSFTDRVETALRRAGWLPTRRVDTIKWETDLQDAGFPIPNEFRPILGNLGGLTVTPECTASDVVQLHPICFDPSSGLDDAEYILSIRDTLALTPIASSLGDNVIICVAHDGSIYGVWEDLILSFGDSIGFALDEHLLYSSTLPRRFTILPDGSVKPIPW